jgi:hypothetical protein
LRRRSLTENTRYRAGIKKEAQILPGPNLSAKDDAETLSQFEGNLVWSIGTGQQGRGHNQNHDQKKNFVFEHAASRVMPR